MQHASVFPASPRLVWFPLLAILASFLSMPSATGAGTLDDWSEAPGRRLLADMPPPAYEQLETQREPQRVAQQPSRPGVTERPGRSGVTEQPSRSGVTEQSSSPGVNSGKVKHDPQTPGGHIIVEAELNRKVSVPLMLDTGATYTVLTKPTIEALRLTGIERLPKRRFETGGGVVLLPVTTLKSIRVGSAEVHEVEVAIDIHGHVSMGVLGMSFLRHFNVTLDPAQGQVKFERR